MTSITLDHPSLTESTTRADEARRLSEAAGEGRWFDPLSLLAAAAAMPCPRGGTQDALSGPGLGFKDGRTFRLILGPGVAQLSAVDAVRRERTAERVAAVAIAEADAASRRPLYLPWRECIGSPTRQVTEWSNKSRSRMVKAFASVDWVELQRCYCGLTGRRLGPHTAACPGSLPLGMVTLTYPGAWEGLVPTGRHAKVHLAAFRRRWQRALGWRLDGAWKLEFQRRGAPHFHLLVPVPALVAGQRFEEWLSATWADVVGAEGEERERHEAAGTGVDFASAGKMSDPKRCGVYFLKHSTKAGDSKEYQHVVPLLWQGAGKGPGRFWGFWGLRPATVAVELGVDDWIVARRVLRRVRKAAARTVAYRRARAAARACGLSPEAATRHAMQARGRAWRTLGAGGRLSGGYVVVTDGSRLAGDLARAVNAARLL